MLTVNGKVSDVFGNSVLNGSLQLSDASTGGVVIQAAEAAANITATHTITLQTNVPSGSRIIGCQLRVDTALTAGETWDAAYVTGSTQSICTAQAVTKSTKVTTWFDVKTDTDIASGEVDVVIQKNSNPGVDSFSALGNIRAIVYYMSFVPMADAS